MGCFSIYPDLTSQTPCIIRTSRPSRRRPCTRRLVENLTFCCLILVGPSAGTPRDTTQLRLETSEPFPWHLIKPAAMTLERPKNSCFFCALAPPSGQKKRAQNRMREQGNVKQLRQYIGLNAPKQLIQYIWMLSGTPPLSRHTLGLQMAQSRF